MSRRFLPVALVAAIAAAGCYGSTVGYATDGYYYDGHYAPYYYGGYYRGYPYGYPYRYYPYHHGGYHRYYPYHGYSYSPHTVYRGTRSYRGVPQPHGAPYHGAPAPVPHSAPRGPRR